MSILVASEDRIGYDLNIIKNVKIDNNNFTEEVEISIFNIPIREIAQEIEEKFSNYECSLTIESLAKSSIFRIKFCVDYFDFEKIINEFKNSPIPEDTLYLYAIMSANMFMPEYMNVGSSDEDKIININFGSDYDNSDNDHIRYYKIREDINADNAINLIKSIINNPQVPVLFNNDTRLCSLFILAEIVNITQSSYISDLIPVLGNRLEVQIESFKKFDLRFLDFIKNMNTVQATAFLSILKVRVDDYYDPLGYKRENIAYIFLAKVLSLIDDTSIATSTPVESKGLSNLQYVTRNSQNFIISAYGEDVLQKAKEQLMDEPYENNSFADDSVIIYQAIANIQNEESIPIEVRLALDGLA